MDYKLRLFSGCQWFLILGFVPSAAGYCHQILEHYCVRDLSEVIQFCICEVCNLLTVGFLQHLPEDHLATDLACSCTVDRLPGNRMCFLYSSLQVLKCE